MSRRQLNLVRAQAVLVLLFAIFLVSNDAAGAAPDTIFGSATPATIDSEDGSSAELGVKFRSEVAGNVTGIRFYKAATNTGTHIGSLWSNSGNMLASATFTGETASGWQQVNFSSPVPIAANATYVASYFAPNGHYSDTAAGFATSGFSSPPLSALANSVSPDGVYSYSATTTFPTNTFNATNYWVDVDFEPAEAAAPGRVTNVNATAGNGSANLTWSAPSTGGAVSTYTITPYVGSEAKPSTKITGTPPSTGTTITGLTNGTSYTFTVQASNEIGEGPVSEHSNAVTPGEVPIAYPDLQLLMPTDEMSIIHQSGSKMLEFTHITEDAGAGPLEIRPVYNHATGISQGYQALYTMPSPGVWKFARTVPIVGPMIWSPPDDYNFPLDKFWLYSVGSEGGPGNVLATSPKDLFCMTSDTFVGGVPNTPNSSEYSPGSCQDEEGTLGLSVGWGDEYDATDGGEGIDISSLPNGTYWLRGEADPDHYLMESNASNDLTDTKLRIEANTVTVLEQTHPNSTPPTVNLTSPASESSISGTVTLTATAKGSAPISSVQFLLDGQPIGSPVTKAPYTIKWLVGSTPAGKHFLSAQATDANGFIGTAADTPVTVGSKIGSVTIATKVSQTGTTTVTTPSFSTSEPGEVLLAFADSNGPSPGPQTLNVSGAGLTWSLVKRANAQPGDAEIWTATASEPLSEASVTSSASLPGFSQSLTVVALSGASGVGSSATAGAPKGAPTVSLTSSGVGSTAFATGNDWTKSAKRKLGPGQEMLEQTLEPSTGDTYWTQYATAPSTAVGQTITLNDTGPTGDHWNLAAVEVLPSAPEQPDTEPPTVSIVNPVGGQTVGGTTQVSATASDNVAIRSVQFFLDGKPLGAPVTDPPYAISWNTTEVAEGAHTLTATATDTSGNVGDSEPVTVTVENPLEESPCFVADVTTYVEGGKSVTTQTFTTAEGNEKLFAFVAGDGPSGAGTQSATVSGAGLTWSLVKRSNGQPGDAEIWTATATKRLVNKRVKSVLKVKGYDQQLTVLSMQGSNGAGASATAGAASGEPSVSLTTTGDGSLVYAVGSDPDSATGRTLGLNQVLLRQDLDSGAGATYWSQYTGAVTGDVGSLVTLNDTAPTNDRWNMAAVEILADDG